MPVAEMPRREASTGGAREFTISDWKAFEKATLRGFLTITMPSGMILRGCSLHEREGSRWIGLPAQKYEKDGATSYKPMIEFTSKQNRDRFNEAALRAIDAAGVAR